METRFVKSADGVRIAYDVAGTGPALVLLHGGFIQTRRDWLPYRERLSREFTLITIDLRGHGESDRPATEDAYAHHRFIDDLQTVADACGVKKYFLWGYSLGGTVALQIAAGSKQAEGAIFAGVWFGKLFTEEMTAALLARAEAVEKARAEGKFEEMQMSTPERDFFNKADSPVMKAYYRALVKYPAVEPRDLLCPAFVFAGTANAMAAGKLKERENEIRAAGARVQLFEGLTHAQEFSEVDRVLPSCLAFLRSLR
ncbi:MAG: alpha/beta fold hydrolase [Acidobacteriota bacterium]